MGCEGQVVISITGEKQECPVGTQEALGPYLVGGRPQNPEQQESTLQCVVRTALKLLNSGQ